jgi:hypothetical protein
MRDQWSKERKAFLCKYTGVELTETYGNTRYATWEHRDAGDESSVVLVADLVNRVKGDRTESEFSAMVRALADHFVGPPFDESAFPVRHGGCSGHWGGDPEIAGPCTPPMLSRLVRVGPTSSRGERARSSHLEHRDNRCVIARRVGTHREHSAAY